MKKMKDVYKKIAKMYGVSHEEVKREIENALAFARQNQTPESRDFWENASECTDEIICDLARRSLKD